MAVDLIRLIMSLEVSWDANSSYLPDEWSPDNPARGQCSVSSLIVQDYLGGDIIRFVVGFGGVTEKHFANLIEGALVDTTFSQHPDDADIRLSTPNLKGYKDLRTKLLADEDTARRYKYLKLRLQNELGLDD